MILKEFIDAFDQKFDGVEYMLYFADVVEHKEGCFGLSNVREIGRFRVNSHGMKMFEMLPILKWHIQEGTIIPNTPNMLRIYLQQPDTMSPEQLKEVINNIYGVPSPNQGEDSNEPTD